MMKHPVLARVFAVVLAIMGLLLLLNGVSGLRKNDAEHAERLAWAEKYAGRIDQYVQLKEETENSASYDEAAAALSRLVEEHERSASRHRTDTALFTAEKGGYKMGEELIASAQAQMNGLRQQIRDASSMRSLLEAVINQALAENKSRMPWLDALTNSCLKAAGECYHEGAKFTVAIVELEALVAAEPSAEPGFAAPEIPEIPAVPYNPFTPETVSPFGWAGGMTAGSAQDLYGAYQQAGADYAQAMQEYAAGWGEYSAAMTEYQSAMAQQEMYEFSAGYYRQGHDAWSQECRKVRATVDFPAAAAFAHAQRTLAASVSGSAAAALSALLEQVGQTPGLDGLAELAESAQTRLEELSQLDPSEMSNEEFLEKAKAAQDTLNRLGDAFTAVAARLSNPGAIIAEAAQKLHVTDVLVRYLEYMLDRAEKEMQAQLENMWYYLGESEKKRVTLEAEKLGLDEEARILRRQTVTTEELRDLKNRHLSARQLVLNVPEVKAASAADGDVAGSARAYLERYGQETERLYRGKRLLNLIAIIGGALGFAGIPAAFEKLRGRFWLICPVLLCLGCAAGADYINMSLGLGQMYTALFTGIFAFLQLLIVLPKKRRPKAVPKH